MLEQLSNDSQSVTTSLENLNASYNNLTGVPSFSSSNNLIKLDLTYNLNIELNSKSFENLKNLTHLNVSYCKLSELPEDIFTYQENLQFIDLSHNELKSIDMKVFLPSFSTLKTINLNRNEITELLGELPRTLFLQLETLSLEYGNIDCNDLVDFVRANGLSKIHFLEGCE